MTKCDHISSHLIKSFASIFQMPACSMQYVYLHMSQACMFHAVCLPSYVTSLHAPYSMFTIICQKPTCHMQYVYLHVRSLHAPYRMFTICQKPACSMQYDYLHMSEACMLHTECLPSYVRNRHALCSMITLHISLWFENNHHH